MGFFASEAPRRNKYDDLTTAEYLNLFLDIEGRLIDHTIDDLDRLERRARRIKRRKPPSWLTLQCQYPARYTDPIPGLRRSCWTLLHLIGEKRLVALLREYVEQRNPADKSRDFYGKDAEPLFLRLAMEDGKVVWTHETLVSERERQVQELLDRGLTQTEVAKELQLTKGRISQIVAKLKEKDREA